MMQSIDSHGLTGTKPRQSQSRFLEFSIAVSDAPAGITTLGKSEIRENAIALGTKPGDWKYRWGMPIIQDKKIDDLVIEKNKRFSLLPSPSIR